MARAAPTRAKPSGTRSGKAKPAKSQRLRPAGPRWRMGLFVRCGLILATLGAGVALAAIPVTELLDQRVELSEVEAERDALRQGIAAIEREIKPLSGEEGIRQRGRCFGPYVEPGEETYAIPGVDGCVSSP